MFAPELRRRKNKFPCTLRAKKTKAGWEYTRITQQFHKLFRLLQKDRAREVGGASGGREQALCRRENGDHGDVYKRQPLRDTRKQYGEVTNPIARKGQGRNSLAESRGRASGGVKGQRPLGQMCIRDRYDTSNTIISIRESLI